MHKSTVWKLRKREMLLGKRTLIMGVLNVTPDSFSDGGKYAAPELAIARALELEEQGADILDIGAESTKPGSLRISAEEELGRLVPVLEKLKGKLQIPISVDTYKSKVAERALTLGAEIVNDPSGNLWDLPIARVVAKYDAGFILNHMRGTPETWSKLAPLKSLMTSIAIDFEASINRARQSGVQRHQMVLDPGLGFGKRQEQNSEIIAQLGRLTAFELPVAIGPSRKSFLRTALGKTGAETEDLDTATTAAVAACILNGAHIVRVHDVARAKIAVEVADAVRYAHVPEPKPVEEVRPQKAQARWQRGQ